MACGAELSSYVYSLARKYDSVRLSRLPRSQLPLGKLLELTLGADHRRPQGLLELRQNLSDVQRCLHAALP